MSLKCAHCTGSGTCKNGKEGVSCDRCVTKAGEDGLFTKRKIESPYGLPCSVCQGEGGLGNQRFGRTITPGLALLIIVISLSTVLLISMKTAGTHDEAIIAFLGTLCGSVTGYYFGGKTPIVVKSPAAKKATPKKIESTQV